MRAALVLAGGRSTRLGEDKALLRLDGVPLVEWLPERLRRIVPTVAVVVDRPGRYVTTCPQLFDVIPSVGPLAGIAAGLVALPNSALFVCACDMPLLRAALVARLFAALERYDLVIPEWEGRLQPLCAVYTPHCLAPIQRLLAAGRLRAGGVAEVVSARVLAEADWRDTDPEGESFLSVNTPAELARLAERARRYGWTVSPGKSSSLGAHHAHE